MFVDLQAETNHADTSTDAATPVQILDNLPDEILNQPRFFQTKGKIPVVKEWQRPKMQHYYNGVKVGLGYFAGFDICGHGGGADYLVLDFDHVFDEKGNFVNETAQKWYDLAAQSGTYIEKSVSGRGLHIICRPRPGEFPKMASGKFARLDLGDGACVEIFYMPGGRYFLLTGDVYKCAPKTPITTDCGVVHIILDEIQKQHTARPASKTAANIENAREMTNFIPCKDLHYNDWLAVGMILKTNGNPIDDWINWSATDPARFDEETCRYKWDTFSDNGDLTIATLCYMAKQYGYQPSQKFDDDFDSADFVDISDLANAQRIFDFCNGTIRYLYDADKWLLYDGQKWNISTSATAAPLYKYVVGFSKAVDNKKIAKSLANTRKINAAITLIKGIGDAIITRADLNNHPHLLNCKNGVIDLQTKILYPADPSLLLTQMVNADYRADYKNADVDKFLRDIMPNEDTRRALLRYLGYCLTGEVSEEKLVLFNGSGGNGKGTLTGTLLRLLGNYGTPFPASAVLLGRNPADEDANAPTPAYNKLIDTRLAISEEIPQGKKIDAAKLKLLTGGDRIPIRRLHEEATEIENPTHKLIISGNYFPELQDAGDDGINRRLMIIPFKAKFTDKNRDADLKKKLITPDALSGLLSLLVDDAAGWYELKELFGRGGLLESSEMITAKNNYHSEQDFISAFLAEYCVFAPDKSIKMQTLIEKLREYCPDETKFLSDRSLRPMLTRTLESRPGVTRGSRKNKTVFFGVNISATDAQEDFETDPITAAEERALFCNDDDEISFY